jgi:hypothetical protein
MRRSDCDRLATLMAGLPGRERESLALKYGAGMTTRAIARMMGQERITRRHDGAPHGAGTARRLVMPRRRATDDKFLHDLRPEPTQEFAGTLRARLRR